MTVHMIRIQCEPANGNARRAVDNWVQNYNEWQGYPDEHGFAVREVPNGQYCLGNYRFTDEGEEPTNILNDLADGLESLQGGLWYRVGYHVCDHDENDRDGCSWDEQRENGQVPSWVPDIS